MDLKDKSCPICFDDLEENVAACLPCRCFFCLKCIVKHSRLSNNCPLDRRAFLSLEIIVDSEVFSQVPVNIAEPHCEEPELVGSISCEICGTHEFHLIRCSTCGLHFHEKCVGSKKTSKVGFFLCPTCTKVFHSRMFPFSGSALSSKDPDDPKNQDPQPSTSSTPPLAAGSRTPLTSICEMVEEEEEYSTSSSEKDEEKK